MTSSFRALQSSKESLGTLLRGKKKPTGLLFLPALLGLSLLLYFGGKDPVWVSGLAVAIPGILLIASPPSIGLGRALHVGMAILMGAALFAFLPQFILPQPDWRSDAVTYFSIHLPFTLSIQPWKSWECFLMLLAGISWFYVLAGRQVNTVGWRYFFAGFNIFLLGISLLALFGGSSDAGLSGERSRHLVLFNDAVVIANILGLGGCISACYGLHGLLKGKMLNLLSLVVSLVVITALYLTALGTGLLLFFVGLGIWLIVQGIHLSRKVWSKLLMPLLLILLVLWVVIPGGTIGQLLSIAIETPQGGVAERVPVYMDCVRLIIESPLAGIGLGNFEAIFPQYQLFSIESGDVVDPQSDLLWLLAEGGLLSFIGLVCCAYGYARNLRKTHTVENSRHRRIALLAAILFFVHSLVATLAHQPGSLYFALMLAALAMPVRSLPASRLPDFGWRLIGGFLIFNGLLWVLGDILQVGLHSQVARNVLDQRLERYVPGDINSDLDIILEKGLSGEPLDWRLHHQRGVFALSSFGEEDSAASDFKRAAFSNPVRSRVRFEEGLAWQEYDLSRASVAWRDAIYRQSEDRLGLFRGMIESASKNPLMKDRLSQLSLLEAVFRKEYLLSLEGRRLHKEIAKDFSVAPGLSNFDYSDRIALVTHWIEFGDVTEIDRFLEEYGHQFEELWYLKAKLLARKVEYDRALQLVIDNLDVGNEEEFDPEEEPIELIERSYEVLPGDMKRGLHLLRAYLEVEEYAKALDLVNELMDSFEVTREVFYWRAELFRRMGDLSDSWHAFEDYLNYQE